MKLKIKLWRVYFKMTVKELKEILEVLIEDDKGHYTVYVGDSIDEPVITVTDFFDEVNISSSDED